jgi:hypothetical protein
MLTRGIYLIKWIPSKIIILSTGKDYRHFFIGGGIEKVIMKNRIKETK